MACETLYSVSNRSCWRSDIDSNRANTNRKDIGRRFVSRRRINVETPDVEYKIAAYMGPCVTLNHCLRIEISDGNSANSHVRFAGSYRVSRLGIQVDVARDVDRTG